MRVWYVSVTLARDMGTIGHLPDTHGLGRRQGHRIRAWPCRWEMAALANARRRCGGRGEASAESRSVH